MFSTPGGTKAGMKVRSCFYFAFLVFLVCQPTNFKHYLFVRLFSLLLTGVDDILSGPWMEVKKALEYPGRMRTPLGSSGDRIWGKKHYKAVLRLIAANPYHAVPRTEVHAALKDVGGIPENVTADEVLLSMVEFNVVSLRPYSKMAKDIPREAFFKEAGGKEKKDDVVTMSSPAHLGAALLLETEFQRLGERWQ